MHEDLGQEITSLSATAEVLVVADAATQTPRLVSILTGSVSSVDAPSGWMTERMTIHGASSGGFNGLSESDDAPLKGLEGSSLIVSESLLQAHLGYGPGSTTSVHGTDSQLGEVSEEVEVCSVRHLESALRRFEMMGENSVVPSFMRAHARTHRALPYKYEMQTGDKRGSSMRARTLEQQTTTNDQRILKSSVHKSSVKSSEIF